MILNLVDRRTGADGTSEFFHGERWQLLCRLAAGIGAPEWCVDVVLVDDETMGGLNCDYRDHEGVTDVLSFSYLEFEGTGPPELAQGNRHAPGDVWLPAEPESAIVGELALAPAFIATRCAENTWPLALEFPLLVVHGCLHLMGWDHTEKTEQKAMQDLEVTILAEHDLPHPLRQRS